jgi:hypothetical protein
MTKKKRNRMPPLQRIRQLEERLRIAEEQRDRAVAILELEMAMVRSGLNASYHRLELGNEHNALRHTR